MGDSDGFFGFDTSIPPEDRLNSSNNQLNSLDPLDDEDDLTNAETFGDLEDLGEEFDFEQNNAKFLEIEHKNKDQEKNFQPAREDFQTWTNPGGSNNSIWSTQTSYGSPTSQFLQMHLNNSPMPIHQMQQQQQQQQFIPPTNNFYSPPISQQPQQQKILTMEEIEGQYYKGSNQQESTQNEIPWPFSQSNQKQSTEVEIQNQTPPQQNQKNKSPWGTSPSQNTKVNMAEIISEQKQQSKPQPQAQQSHQSQQQHYHQGQYERRHQQPPKLTREQYYHGLMSPSEKQFITRIQLAQLHIESDRQHIEDYYFYASMKKRSAQNQEILPILTLPKLKSFAMTKPQRGTESVVSAEGALGVIPRHSVNRPRVLFNIKDLEKEQIQDPSQKPKLPEKVLSKTKQIRVLKSIEDLYDYILKLEDIHYEVTFLALLEENRTKKLEQTNELITKIAQELSTTIDGMSKEEFILHFMKYPKGTKILRKALPLLNGDEQYEFLVSLLKIFDQLHILDPQSPVDQINSFLQCVIFPLMPLVENLDFTKINECMEILLGHTLFGIFSLARSKVGLKFFEFLFVRAQQLKTSDNVDKTELSRWDDNFKVFFSLMVNNYHNLLLLTEQYLMTEIWTFFTLLALHATTEQRYSLLAEIRDRVMEVVRGPDNGAKQPVINFLSIMGINTADLFR